MGNHLGVILGALAVGEALPGAIENTLLILARFRRDASKPRPINGREVEPCINEKSKRRRSHWQMSARLMVIVHVEARQIHPAAAHPVNRHTILGTIRRAFTDLRRREPTVRETDITDEAIRELAQWFQQQYDMEALVDEETAGWAEEREMVWAPSKS